MVTDISGQPFTPSANVYGSPIASAGPNKVLTDKGFIVSSQQAKSLEQQKRFTPVAQGGFGSGSREIGTPSQKQIGTPSQKQMEKIETVKEDVKVPYIIEYSPTGSVTGILVSPEDYELLKGQKINIKIEGQDKLLAPITGGPVPIKQASGPIAGKNNLDVTLIKEFGEQKATAQPIDIKRTTGIFNLKGEKVGSSNQLLFVDKGKTFVPVGSGKEGIVLIEQSEIKARQRAAETEIATKLAIEKAPIIQRIAVGLANLPGASIEAGIKAVESGRFSPVLFFRDIKESIEAREFRLFAAPIKVRTGQIKGLEIAKEFGETVALPALELGSLLITPSAGIRGLGGGIGRVFSRTAEGGFAAITVLNPTPENIGIFAGAKGLGRILKGKRIYIGASKSFERPLEIRQAKVIGQEQGGKIAIVEFKGLKVIGKDEIVKVEGLGKVQTTSLPKQVKIGSTITQTGKFDVDITKIKERKGFIQLLATKPRETARISKIEKSMLKGLGTSQTKIIGFEKVPTKTGEISFPIFKVKALSGLERIGKFGPRIQQKAGLFGLGRQTIQAEGGFIRVFPKIGKTFTSKTARSFEIKGFTRQVIFRRLTEPSIKIPEGRIRLGRKKIGFKGRPELFEEQQEFFGIKDKKLKGFGKVIKPKIIKGDKTIKKLIKEGFTKPQAKAIIRRGFLGGIIKEPSQKIGEIKPSQVIGAGASAQVKSLARSIDRALKPIKQQRFIPIERFRAFYAGQETIISTPKGLGISKGSVSLGRQEAGLAQRLSQEISLKTKQITAQLGKQAVITGEVVIPKETTGLTQRQITRQTQRQITRQTQRQITRQTQRQITTIKPPITFIKPIIPPLPTPRKGKPIRETDLMARKKGERFKLKVGLAKRSAKPDILSIIQSQIAFGKVTFPRPTGKRIQKALRTAGFKFPTLEQERRPATTFRIFKRSSGLFIKRTKRRGLL